MGSSESNDITNILDAQKRINQHLDVINRIRRDLTMQYYGIMDINIYIEKIYDHAVIGKHPLYHFESKITLDIKK